ncbi:mandelate racemase/muconate lactonizing enzyme family protein [Sulfolobus tengchongensis]|uniref:Mandelate racemase/muconate lactonizing enzyme family protein n=1 Tax=Sulfolobus tengchongensis TaxID=207809 RepID=A0AAX4L2N3_9CREN
MIKKIDFVKANIPLEKTDPLQLWYNQWSSQLFVKIVNDENITGWGEILATTANSRDVYISLGQKIAKAILGKDEEEICEINDLLFKILETGKGAVSSGVISGIDIALWDLLGKKLKRPIYKILGYSGKDIPRYIALSRYKDADSLKRVLKKFMEKGFKIMKIHEHYTRINEIMKEIRDNFGFSIGIIVDLSSSIPSYEKAKRLFNIISKYEPLWIEDPLKQTDDYASLKKLNEIIPIAGGENIFTINEFRRAIENEAYTYFQIDTTKIGGITEAVKRVTLAKAYNVSLSFHHRPDNGWIGISANYHIAVTAHDKFFLETPPDDPYIYFKVDGEINVDYVKFKGIGLGIEPRENIPSGEDQEFIIYQEP